jgi:hypothetical protein
MEIIELILIRCLLGGIPVITAFAHAEYNVGIKTEVAKIIYRLCNSTNQALQMFIACRFVFLVIDNNSSLGAFP